ncbi:hypothetical protein EDI_096020 [Entamoeba dispar SAW760]|uniref:UEV domain-containing protein n=1 Tax=Entamoeba dispar (strain ATCC PRA-260 / SAW760) TaxID=370354 RepID=B0EPP0_ENTDS|nr:uncharacterized protein EDI_096020 [Entamoeba dispar SAW760]EDR23470.1 hypothetical protein EDI_096020 [Entamoeba dispar SAW760]|eukprot:EDR23470.1 hypothetical protein EDI_096020 [Entamoeba dispar SAW760]
MLTEDFLNAYLISSGADYINKDIVIKEIVQVVNKHHLSICFDPITKTIVMYGELLYNYEIYQYSFPILVDFPSDYPKLLPIIKVNLPHIPRCSLLNSDGSFIFKQLLGDKTLPLVNIFEIIISQLKLIPLQSIPFYPLSSPISTVGSSQYKPNIIQSDLGHTKTESSLIYRKDIQFPKPNKVENGPVVVKPITPINVKPITPINVKPIAPINNKSELVINIKPISPVNAKPISLVNAKPTSPIRTQVKGNPPKPAQTIIIGKRHISGFENIDLYLDQIDYENKLEYLGELLGDQKITKEDYNRFKSDLRQIGPLPPPPENYEDILSLYKYGNIKRSEIYLNVSPSNKEEKGYIKNMDELDEMQRTFAEMFLDGDIDEEEMTFLNNSYKEHFRVKPE